MNFSKEEWAFLKRASAEDADYGNNFVALKNLLTEVDLLLSTTTPLPENRTPRCRELLSAALAIVDDLPKQSEAAPAAVLGHKGGSTTSQRHGAEHYRKMAASRKTHAGGRPRKQAK